jgi:hypothetical protein
MKMCLAPCFKGCTDERYAEEAAKVEAFLATRGQSLLDELAKERDAASEELDFEKAAAIHAKMQKVEGVAALASEAVHPLAQLRAIIVQPAIQLEGEPGRVALFQLVAGVITGPVLYDTLGMRLHNEQSGSSSLYTHPYALEAVPLQEGPMPRTSDAAATVTKAKATSKDTPRDVLEQRLADAIAQLNQIEAKSRPNTQPVADHLSLFTRWYYRPEAKRIGEVIFFKPDEAVPSKALLRAISPVFRSALPNPSAESIQMGPTGAAAV